MGKGDSRHKSRKAGKKVRQRKFLARKLRQAWRIKDQRDESREKPRTQSIPGLGPRPMEGVALGVRIGANHYVRCPHGGCGGELEVRYASPGQTRFCPACGKKVMLT